MNLCFIGFHVNIYIMSWIIVLSCLLLIFFSFNTKGRIDRMSGSSISFCQFVDADVTKQKNVFYQAHTEMVIQRNPIYILKRIKIKASTFVSFFVIQCSFYFEYVK